MSENDLCPNCSAPLAVEATNCRQCGQMFCPACFEPIDEWDEFCAWCNSTVSISCPDCGRKVKEDALVCPTCGLLLRDIKSQVVPEYTRFRSGDESEQENSNGSCPSCDSSLFIEDGFCKECGQAVCNSCGHSLEDDDEVCSNCGQHLYFDCPLCEFELTAGTEICPNCNALFPTVCPGCGNLLKPGTDRCPQCRRLLPLQQRLSARTIRSFIVGRKMARIVSCPTCGDNFDPAQGDCPDCGQIVCGQCQLILQADEIFCPRCAWETSKTR